LGASPGIERACFYPHDSTKTRKAVERDGRVNGNLDKAWLRDFDGWDLSAYCFVEWHTPDTPIKTTGLTRATIQAVHQDQLKELAEEMLANLPARHMVDQEPTATQRVEDSTILEFLIQEGLRPAAGEELTTAFRRIRLLARYYYHKCQWGDIREHETRTFLILPLLLALGWSEQQIKIELGLKGGSRVDVVCFSKPYRRDHDGKANEQDCVLMLESKGFTYGLDFAPNQARGYAEYFPNCRVVVVSNGYCYKTYLRDTGGVFKEKPSAYLNLLNPQDRYPLDPKNVNGCLEVLRLLLPSSCSK
jgi:hypothetical protein